MDSSHTVLLAWYGTFPIQCPAPTPKFGCHSLHSLIMMRRGMLNTMAFWVMWGIYIFWPIQKTTFRLSERKWAAALRAIMLNPKHGEWIYWGSLTRSLLRFIVSGRMKGLIW